MTNRTTERLFFNVFFFAPLRKKTNNFSCDIYVELVYLVLIAKTTWTISASKRHITRTKCHGCPTLSFAAAIAFLSGNI